MLNIIWLVKAIPTNITVLNSNIYLIYLHQTIFIWIPQKKNFNSPLNFSFVCLIERVLLFYITDYTPSRSPFHLFSIYFVKLVICYHCKLILTQIHTKDANREIRILGFLKIFSRFLGISGIITYILYKEWIVFYLVFH